MKEENRGITLIALTVTIVVLLILAGVTTKIVLDKGGIVGKAQNAQNVVDSANKKDNIFLSNLENEMDTYMNSTDISNSEQGGNTNGVEDTNQLPEDTSYVGYYADIDGDGAEDGIIYADLAIGGSGIWNNNSWSTYNYEKVTQGLKKYYISKQNYTGFNGQWTKPVITAKEGTGKDRFYVMALEDLTPKTYCCWYTAAYGKLDEAVSKGTTTNDFGQGKTNTTTMITNWNSSSYGSQNTHPQYKDIWGMIPKKVDSKIEWFLPSKAEWSAFGNMAFTKMRVTTGNYGEYNFEYAYFSSTQYDSGSVYIALFNRGALDRHHINGPLHARLSATF